MIIHAQKNNERCELLPGFVLVGSSFMVKTHEIFSTRNLFPKVRVLAIPPMPPIAPVITGRVLASPPMPPIPPVITGRAHQMGQKCNIGVIFMK